MNIYQDQLSKLLQEETELQFDEFTNDLACTIGNRIIHRASQNNQKIVVDIRLHGECIFYARMNDKTSRNDEWIGWKNNTVNHYRHSSYYMHVLLKSKEASVEDDGLDPDIYKAVGGAFPVRDKENGLIGTITVSGLTGEQDHYMVVDTLKEMITFQ